MDDDRQAGDAPRQRQSKNKGSPGRKAKQQAASASSLSGSPSRSQSRSSNDTPKRAERNRKPAPNRRRRSRIPSVESNKSSSVESSDSVESSFDPARVAIPEPLSDHFASAVEKKNAKSLSESRIKRGKHKKDYANIVAILSSFIEASGQRPPKKPKKLRKRLPKRLDLITREPGIGILPTGPIDALYIVRAGVVDALWQSSVVLDSVFEHDYFGELPLLFQMQYSVQFQV